MLYPLSYGPGYDFQTSCLLLHNLVSIFNMKKISFYLAGLRPPFFTGTIIPILFGTAYCWHRTGEFSLWLFILTMIGGVAIHGGANAINDYFDHKNGNDGANKEFAHPFTGGSRAIQNGLLTPREMFIEAFICFAIGAAIGLYLVYTRGLMVLWIGLFGMITSYFYSAPPVKLVHRGIGEIFIGLDFGVLMILGTYFVQCQEISMAVILASLPISVLIIMILYINEFQDMNADISVGKMNWVARLGRRKASYGYAALTTLVYLLIMAESWADILPMWSLISLISIPLAIKAIKNVLKNYDHALLLTETNAATIQLHLIIGLLLSLSCLIA